jgi:hypothetical protein
MRRRWIESFLAAVSLALFAGLGFWMLKSDGRLDEARVGLLHVRGNSGKLFITWGHDPAAAATVRAPGWPSWVGYTSVPYDDSGDTPGCPPLRWSSFTYTSSELTRNVIVPAWLPLLTLAIMPGMWIYGMPSKPRRQRSEDTSETAAAT